MTCATRHSRVPLSVVFFRAFLLVLRAMITRLGVTVRAVAVLAMVVLVLAAVPGSVTEKLLGHLLGMTVAGSAGENKGGGKKKDGQTEKHGLVGV